MSNDNARLPDLPGNRTVIDQLEDSIFNALLMSLPMPEAEAAVDQVLANVINLLSDYIAPEIHGLEKSVVKSASRKTADTLISLKMMREIVKASFTMKRDHAEKRVAELQTNISRVNEMVSQCLMKQSHGKETILSHRQEIARQQAVIKSLNGVIAKFN